MTLPLSYLSAHADCACWHTVGSCMVVVATYIRPRCSFAFIGNSTILAINILNAYSSNSLFILQTTGKFSYLLVCLPRYLPRRFIIPTQHGALLIPAQLNSTYNHLHRLPSLPHYATGPSFQHSNTMSAFPFRVRPDFDAPAVPSPVFSARGRVRGQS